MDAGIPIMILLASKNVFTELWPLYFDSPRTIMVERGKDNIKPPKTGLNFEIHKTVVKRIEVSIKLSAISNMSNHSTK